MSRAMKGGSIMMIPSAESHGLSPANHQHQCQSQISMNPSVCSVFGGIKRVWYTMSCSWMKPSLGIATDYNWCTWAMQWQKTATAGIRQKTWVILQHNNARLHATEPVKTYLETLNWKVVPHLPYSTDIVYMKYIIKISKKMGQLVDCI